MKSNNTLPQTTSPILIKDQNNFSNHGIILISDQAQQDIFTKSGPLADRNEFQTHYWFLNFRHVAADNSILDIAIPTVYFNYKQSVSGAHIDFEIKDVADLSSKIIPIHNMKVNELLAGNIKTKLENYFAVSFQTISVDVGSIHRHPGSSKHQAFSGTDLSKAPTDHGVVYPFGSASDNKPNFAGIMAIDSGTCNVAHYEYRTANGTLGTDITYAKGRCCAIVYKDKPTREISLVEQMFSTPVNNYVKECHSLLSESDHTLLAEMLLEINFKPFTDSVRSENVSAKIYNNTQQFAWNPFKSYAKQPIKTTYKQPALPGLEPELPKYYEKEELIKMNIQSLMLHLKELDLYYYEAPISDEDYSDFTEAELVDQILEMYVLIIEEEENGVSELQTMMEELESYGVAKTTLLTASEEQIRSWHANC